ncbi:MAG: thioredoxin domain-containing protein [Alphaproteobacteria bacterium]|jgi:protein-disulfide isomerase|nr:thioredoxin domain-containing protein [Alphaproteobacteria bacterium]
MTWTILVLVLGIALYMFGGMLFKGDSKKPTAGNIYAKKAIKIGAIILVAGSVCRLFVPYYLTSVNPSIVQEMVEGMQAQQNAEKNKAIRKYVRESAFEMTENAPILGNPEAKKTVYVWTAASCGYCRRVHGELDRVLKSRDDVKVVMKNFSIHGVMSDGPARAMIAAKMQGNDKAAKFADLVMTREYRPSNDIKDQDKLAEAIEKNLMKFAEEAGLDTAQLKKDMTSDVVARELLNVSELAQRFEITGTPFLIINEEAFPGAIPAAKIIEALDK